MSKTQTTRSMVFLQEEKANHQLVPGHYFLYNWIMPYIKDTSHILDIGCWTGALEILFQQHSCRVTGIDIEDEPLRYASRKFPKYSFIKSSVVDKLPFHTNEFDIVTYFMVIEHIPIGTELVSLQNINRVMKSGGRLFFNTMHDTLVSNMIDPAYLFGHRHYKEKDLRILFELAGFKVEEVRYNAGWYTTLHIVLLYFFKHILHRREPRNRFLDSLMWRDYRGKGFAEIDILATKIRDI